MPRFDMRSYLECCVKIRATVLRLVPSIVVSLTKSSKGESLDLSNVRYIMCSGAALDAHVVERLRISAPSAFIVQGYG